MRMLMNNLDPEIAEHPDQLIVYGGGGKAARSWAAYRRHRRELARARARGDAAGPVGQARRRLPDPRVGAAGAHRQRQPRARSGRPGRSSAGWTRSG